MACTCDAAHADALGWHAIRVLEACTWRGKAFCDHASLLHRVLNAAVGARDAPLVHACLRLAVARSVRLSLRLITRVCARNVAEPDIVVGVLREHGFLVPSNVCDAVCACWVRNGLTAIPARLPASGAGVNWVTLEAFIDAGVVALDDSAANVLYAAATSWAHSSLGESTWWRLIGRAIRESVGWWNMTPWWRTRVTPLLKRFVAGVCGELQTNNTVPPLPLAYAVLADAFEAVDAPVDWASCVRTYLVQARPPRLGILRELTAESAWARRKPLLALRAALRCASGDSGDEAGDEGA